MTIFRFIFITLDSRMPLNVCDCFLFAVLKISKGLVFLTRKKNIPNMYVTEKFRFEQDSKP